MNLPITSRIKRSPLLKDKQDPNVKAKASAVTEGEKKDVTTTKTVKGAQVEKLATTPEEKAKYQKYLDDVKSGKVKRNTKYDDKKVTTKTTVETPGEIIDTDLYEERKQDVLSNAEVANAQRATNRTTRNVRKTGDKQDKIKRQQQKLIDKYDTVDPKTGKKDGKISDEERKAMSTGFLGFGNKQKKYDKLKRRATETAQEMEQFSSAQENQARSQKSGRRWKSKIKTDDALKTRGQYNDKEQLQMEKDKLAVERAKLEAAKNQSVTTSSGGQAAGAIDVTEEATPLGSGAKMKSSPYKKALKGSQNQLPQHLQAAIKAAPGKMKGSPYKMKGSMFKKKY